MRKIACLLAIAILLNVGCAGNAAPVVVAQATLGLAETVGQLQESMVKLHQAGVVDARSALKVQQKLLTVNKQIERIVPYLEAIDRLQKSNVKPSAGEIDKLISDVFSILQDLNVVNGEVPVSESTKPFLDLYRSLQTTLTTTMIELGRLRVTLEGRTVWPISN